MDPAVEEALCDSGAMRSLAGINLEMGAAPHETTVYRFHHLFQGHKLGKTLLNG